MRHAHDDRVPVEIASRGCVSVAVIRSAPGSMWELIRPVDTIGFQNRCSKVVDLSAAAVRAADWNTWAMPGVYPGSISLQHSLKRRSRECQIRATRVSKAASRATSASRTSRGTKAASASRAQGNQGQQGDNANQRPNPDDKSKQQQAEQNRQGQQG